MFSRPIRITNRQWRLEDTGFLRVTASISAACVMDYQPGELPQSPITDRPSRVLLPLEAMSSPDTLPTLEGKPVLIGHVWQDIMSDGDKVGAVAGSPRIEGGLLIADLLITTAEAVRRVLLPEGEPERLCEISAGYTADVDWMPGVTPDGREYDGVFRNVRYNHVALLPAGMGRAGADVRIINRRGSMPDFAIVRFRGRSVRVLNEDAAMLEKEIENMDAEVKNQMTPEQVQQALDELKALKDEVGAKNARISELEGQIKAYQEELAAALSPEAVAEVVAEQDDAEEIMNAIGAKMTDKRRTGHDLRVYVVNAVRASRQQPALSDAEAKDQSFVRGLFKGFSAASVGRAPAGAGIVQITNALPGNGIDVNAPLTKDQLFGRRNKEAGK